MRRGNSLQYVFVTLKQDYMREPDIEVMRTGRHGRLPSRLFWPLSNTLESIEVKLRRQIYYVRESGSP